ncbi:hypothetical protein VYA_25560 [Vibrio alfacsensis]|nr:hypothetical protein VYA_05000 [Vibrio alfacsensis]BCN25364.1 hypothetical protein VYA_25560 [Vibrio alfacsensis]
MCFCVFIEMNTLRTLQTNAYLFKTRFVLSAFQIVKELITSHEVTIFKNTLLSIKRKCA